MATSDDTRLADDSEQRAAHQQERRIASDGTSSWTAAPAAVNTLLTDTHLLPSQQEGGAASAAFNTMLTDTPLLAKGRTAPAAGFVPHPPPRRIARDGKAYTEEDFQHWSGVACSKIWDAAIPESSVAKPAPDHVPDPAPAPDPVPARVTVPPEQASSSVAKSATAPALTQAATIQGGPTAEQVARVSAIMGEYRTGNWLDEHERWKRDCA